MSYAILCQLLYGLSVYTPSLYLLIKSLKAGPEKKTREENISVYNTLFLV